MPSSGKARATPSKTSSTSSSRAEKESGKTHKRSRAGCYTCRLRRKKCDEQRESCGACQHLKIECHYTRPSWWSNAEKRATHKEELKTLIKANADKTLKEAELRTPAMQQGLYSPPSLCHSVQTNDAYSDLARTRAASTDSHFSPQFDLDTPKEFYSSTPMILGSHWTPLPPHIPQFGGYPHLSPYEVDVRTEREMFVDDESVRKDSTFSTFSGYQDSPSLGSLDNWIQQDHSEWTSESITEEPLGFDLFDFPHSPGSSDHMSEIHVDPSDKFLLEHFLNVVAPMVYPVLDLSQQASGQRGAILPALETNPSFLHCCISRSAAHLRASGEYDPEQESYITNAISDHQWAAVQLLVNSMQQEDALDASFMLETMLAMIVLESTVAVPSSDVQSIPWHQHLQGAKDVIQRLGLMEDMTLGQQNGSHLPFLATLTSWVDILGATMTGSVPLFCDSYRHKIEHDLPSGLAELMGCDDRVMYLIAEIAALETLKHQEKVDNMTLCTLIASLGERLSMTEIPDEVGEAVSPTGAVRPKQVVRNVTALFRIAARIYLCSLVPGFDRQTVNIRSLVESFSNLMATIPAGPHGLDRSLVWPMLIVGSVSDKDSAFRSMFTERSKQMVNGAKIGSYGRLAEIFEGVWQANDNRKTSENEPTEEVHWREVMAKKNWDLLMM